MKQGPFSHYEVLEQIGAGGMGQVYRARDLKLGREVALKILPSDFAAMPQRRERFLRESRLAAQLSHPRIATIFEADEVDGQLYYAMELIRGDTLEARVRPGGLSPAELLDLAIPLTEGLAAAHKTGVVHRDLKPTNVMVDEHDRLKILDFGLSRIASDEADSALDLTQSQQLLGTPQYMSPEQVRGGTVGTRSDLFSLGAMLYELATGIRPFLGRTQGEVMESVLRTDPPPMQRANPRLGDDLERIVGRLIEKDPTKRMQTADDLLAELRTLRDRVGQSRSAGRRWLVAALSLAAAVALYFGLTSGATTAPGESRIAVLPFQNRGAESDEYFADGITDAITARLAGIRGLGVVSRQSAVHYKNTTLSLAEVAAQLGVTFILSGTVQRERAGDPQSRVRVIPELTRIRDSKSLWADTYDEEGSQVFRVQSEIAERVARALDITLRARERRALESRPTDDLEAYDVFLRGNEYRARGLSEGNLAIAIQMYERAIEMDPEFALAHAQLSRCHVQMYWYRHDHTEARIAAARAAVERAMQLAPDQPAVRLAMGHFYYHGHLDYDRALKEFAIGRDAAPSDSEILAFVAYVHRRQGKLAIATEEMATAREIDPRNTLILTNLGSAYMLQREYEDALGCFDQAIALTPEWTEVHGNKASQTLFGQGEPARARALLSGAQRVVSDPGEDYLTYLSVLAAIWDGDYEAALQSCSKARGEVLEPQNFFVPVAALRGSVHELMGNEAKAHAEYGTAREIVERHIADRPGDPNLHSALGIALAHLGRSEEAIREGRRAVELMPIAKEAWQGSIRATDLAHIYATVGEHELAIDLIEQLLDMPSEVGRASLAVDPRWRPLRDLQRFQALTR